jgi:hypothetical protein
VKPGERLAEDRAVFDSIVELAEGHARRGHALRAAELVEIAARFAWYYHPGRFAEPRLELVARQLGRTAIPRPGRGARQPSRTAGRSTTTRPRVLHVLTEANPIGGHARLAREWMAQDTAREHSLALTRSDAAPTHRMVQAVEASGGRWVHVRRDGSSLLERAAALRELAGAFDVVVLHVHPDDVTPLLAFCDDEHPTVILVNHADHVFWLGVSVADLVLCFRPAGRLVAEQRRGVDPARLAGFTVPFTPPERRVSRDVARSELGFRPGRTLVGTMATSAKFRSRSGRGFLDLVLPLVVADEGLELLAVGPPPTGPWQAAAAATGGRVRAVGPVEHPFLQSHAVDVYLDSHPFGSLTSLIEHGALGTPALAYQPLRSDPSPLASNGPSVGEHLVCAADPDEHATWFRRLVAEVELRTELGQALADHIRDAHAADRWRAQIEEVYAAAAATPRGDVDGGGHDLGALGELDDDLADFELREAGAQRLLRVFRRQHTSSRALALRLDVLASVAPLLPATRRIWGPVQRLGLGVRD